MSDTDKPEDPPAPSEQQPASAATAPGQAPAPAPAPQPGAPEQPGPRARPRLRPAREKPERNPANAGAVPSLEHEQTYCFGKKVDAFDEDVDRELEEVMGGLSDRDLYGEPAGG